MNDAQAKTVSGLILSHAECVLKSKKKKYKICRQKVTIVNSLKSNSFDLPPIQS